MNDKLREALEALDTEAPAVQRMAACRAILRKALAASKQEPQAQAGEPEVVALRWPYKFRDIGETGAYEYHSIDFAVLAHLPLGEELITLQSHREAMAKKEHELNLLGSATDKLRLQLKEEIFGYREAIAKKDAALDACVERAAKAIYEQWSGRPGYVPWQEHGNSLMQDKARKIAAAAITQAKEARK